MATAPYGVRLLVGAAVTAIEETRKLPQTILMYPMTIASQVAHLVMKMQQDVADLVNKGDETLDQLFPPKDEQPEWATFDEDIDGGRSRRPVTPGHRRRTPDRGPLRAVHRRRARHFGRLARQTGEARPGRPTRRRRRAGLRVADAGPVAGPADIAARRRPRGPAGLRRRHQVARTVSDAAGQQDHPRDRQVTSCRAQLRGQSLPRPHRRNDGQGLDRQARHSLGRRSDRPDERPPEFQHRLHHAARPCRGHVAADHLSPRTGSQRPGETHRGHSGDHARQAELLRRPRDVLVARQPDSRGRHRRAAGPHRPVAPAAGRRRACSIRDSSGRSRSCPTPSG